MNYYNISYKDFIYTIINISPTTFNLKIKVEKFVKNKWELKEEYEIVFEESLKRLVLNEGKYRLSITYITGISNEIDFQTGQLVQREITETDVIILKNYFETLEEIGNEMKLAICNNTPCGKDCIEKDEMCKLLLSLTSKLQLWTKLMFPEIKDILASIYEKTEHFKIDYLKCQNDLRYLQGDFPVLKENFKKLLSLDYLSIYLYYNSNPEYSPSIEEIEKLIKFEEVYYCIENKFNISLEDF